MVLYVVLFVLGLVLLIGLICLPFAVCRVPALQNWVIAVGDQPVRTLEPGWYFINPLSEHVQLKISYEETLVKPEAILATTADRAKISIEVAANFRILDRSKLPPQLSRLDSTVKGMVVDAVKAAMGTVDLKRVQANPESVGVKIEKELANQAEDSGLTFTKFEVTKFDVDEETLRLLQFKINAEERDNIIRNLRFRYRVQPGKAQQLAKSA